MFRTGVEEVIKTQFFILPFIVQTPCRLFNAFIVIVCKYVIDGK